MARQIAEVEKYRRALSEVHAHRNHLRWCLEVDAVAAYNEELKKFHKRVVNLKPAIFR